MGSLLPSFFFFCPLGVQDIPKQEPLLVYVNRNEASPFNETALNKYRPKLMRICKNKDKVTEPM